MALKVKWDVEGKGEAAWGGSGERYAGDMPPKGSYIAKLKRVTMGKIKAEGENKGKPRLSILLEIVGGKGADGVDDMDYKYYGAPVWDGVNIIKAQAGRANMFIHSLTDGSDPAKRAIENVFWPPNMDVRAEQIKNTKTSVVTTHIKSIGKTVIGSPNGDILVRIVTKVGKDLEGKARAEVSEYLPYFGEKAKPQPAKEAETEEEEELLDSDSDDEFTTDDIDDDDGLDDSEVDDDPPPF